MEDPVLPTPRKLGAGPETGPAVSPPSGAIPIEAGSVAHRRGGYGGVLTR